MNNSIELIPSQVRRDILRMVHDVQSGHPGGSMGCTEFFVALYFKLLNHSPEPFNMDGNNEDIFFLSNGHISPVFYSVLARSGYFPVEELNTFRKIDSRLQGHPTTHEGLPGIRVASGSLGQGLSVAIGAAQAKRLSGDKNLVFTLHGDGELQEGQIWEAALYAGSKNIDNIIATIDANGQQIDGSTDDVMAMGDIGLKFEAFGWQVIRIEDGNDLSKVIDGLTSGIKYSRKGKPICIIMKTEMGAGVDFMTGTHKWHGIAPNDEQLEIALSQLPETLGDYPL
jgi:transketolase